MVGFGAAILVLSCGLAAGVVWFPVATLVVTAGLAAALVVRSCPKLIEKHFLGLLVVVLVGYALFGRTFAGIGVRPVYIGEVLLGLGLLSVVANGWHSRLVRTPCLYFLIAFMIWGAIRTIPYLGTYGLNALRDAVVWGYGSFVLLLAPVLLRRDLVDRIPALYARLVPWIIVCAPGWVVVASLLGVQGSEAGAALAAPKPGDAAVHLGGAAAFLLTFTRARRASLGQNTTMWLTEWGAWPVLLVGLVLMGSLNRGGLLAALAAMLIVTILLPFRVGGRLVLAGATAILLASMWLGWGISVGRLRGEQDREISPQQIVRNLRSVGGASGTEDLQGTVNWRRLWWNSIIDYTVHGDYFWTGKGFGLNLAYDDGIDPDPDSPLRSPHNGHLTILARAGVPGLVLWILLQFSFAFSMLSGFTRARRDGEDLRVSIFAWILAYWLAFMLNASFDVYLEGPQAGIWYWCIFAYGIAVSLAQTRQVPLPPPGGTSWPRVKPKSLTQPTGV